MLGNERVIYLNFADYVVLLADSCIVGVALMTKMEQETQMFVINISAKKNNFLYTGRGISDVWMEDV